LTADVANVYPSDCLATALHETIGVRMTQTDRATKILPEAQQQHWYNAPNFRADEPWADLDPSRTALVLVDLINWQVAADGPSIQSVRQSGAIAQADHIVARCEEVVLPNLSRLVRGVRAAGIQIVHTRLASRHHDFADIVPALRPYVRAAGARDGSLACEPIPQVHSESGDLSVVKMGSGAFTGSNLDFLLRRLGIDTLLYAGVVTNACVMLSVAAGFDLGYRQYLITDCTGALSEEDQAAAERFIGLYMAQLVTTNGVLAALKEISTSDLG
jgi:nicotinamidase-related amidase